MPIEPTPPNAARPDEVARETEYQRITCGHSHPDPRTEEHFAGARKANASPDDDTGCGRLAVWTMMYRCTECGRFFHRACAEKHFATHRTVDDAQNQLTTLRAAVRLSELSRTYFLSKVELLRARAHEYRKKATWVNRTQHTRAAYKKYADEAEQVASEITALLELEELLAPEHG